MSLPLEIPPPIKLCISAIPPLYIVADDGGNTDRRARVGGVLLGDPQGQVFAPGATKAIVRIPPELNGMSLTSVGACCTTAGATGTTSIQFRRVRSGGSVDMLSTSITIEAGETDSLTAATQAVINAANRGVQSGDQIHFDVSSVGAGALGVFVSFTFKLV